MSSLRNVAARHNIQFLSNCVSFFIVPSTCTHSFGNRKHWIFKMDKSEGFIMAGDYNVFARSVSGLETTVVLRKISEKFNVCFDMGIACRENQSCDRVFISHGHMDHISAVPQHVSKRSLFGMKMAKYYTPHHLKDNLLAVCEIYHQMNETSDALNKVDVIAVKPGENVETSKIFYGQACYGQLLVPGFPHPWVGKGHYVVPFKTVHRIDSQGYILYKRQKKLKAEYREMAGEEIAAKIKAGEVVHDVTHIPEVAFTGDTTFEVFQKPSTPADLFRVKLLIVEATYVDLEDRKDIIKQARDRGHIHLFEIFQNAELFRNVDKILLIHFSDKYSIGYINEQVDQNVPESLRDKIIVSQQR